MHCRDAETEKSFFATSQCYSEELRIFGKNFPLRALRLCAMHWTRGLGCGFAAP